MHRSELSRRLAEGLMIPAHPLALTAQGQLSEKHQRGLTRYYLDAGVGGIAVGVHTTQFEIHDAKVGLLRPVLQMAMDELQQQQRTEHSEVVAVAGVLGDLDQAIGEAELAAELGYHCVLLSYAGNPNVEEDQLLELTRRVSDILPVFGFYLQPAVGGRLLRYRYWREFLELENVVAIKVAPFNRYHTIDVARAVVDSGRKSVSLYTGNDDHWVLDLLTPFSWQTDHGRKEARFVGGLLGHWAFWTHAAKQLFDRCKLAAADQRSLSPDWLRCDMAETDCNGAVFDVANGFQGCNAGILEMLRRDKLVIGTSCLDPNSKVSSSQATEIDRVYTQYSDRRDDSFIRTRRERWLK